MEEEGVGMGEVGGLGRQGWQSGSEGPKSIGKYLK